MPDGSTVIETLDNLSPERDRPYTRPARRRGIFLPPPRRQRTHRPPAVPYRRPRTSHLQSRCRTHHTSGDRATARRSRRHRADTRLLPVVRRRSLATYCRATQPLHAYTRPHRTGNITRCPLAYQPGRNHRQRRERRTRRTPRNLRFGKRLPPAPATTGKRTDGHSQPQNRI